MSPERWQRVESLFHRALEIDPRQRAAFVAAACADDATLQDDVGALLSASEDAGSFIQKPLFEAAVEEAGPQAGQPIGPYTIAREIGRGGMGEVYLAEDARLGRQVALKLLPVQFTSDPERALRFEREARAASALNHPNIITIYEIGEFENTRFIAAEFIEGQTLRQKIKDGNITLAEALDIAGQIAGAIASAHAAGIVHRDIKPENIMVRPDGLVKVLDFGLVRLAEEPEPITTVPSALPCVDARRAELSLLDAGIMANTMPAAGAKTNPGMLMGTLSYMSPEQARGEKVDHRTDIFSLGVVLYEMVTGTTPFQGKTAGAILDAIVDSSPVPIAREQRRLPRELERVISGALEKDREARYQTAAELQSAIRDLQSALHKPRWGGWQAKTALGVGGLVLLAALLYAAPRPKSTTPAAPASLTISAFTSKSLTDLPGSELFPSLTPDGETLAYASRASGNWDIYIKKVGDSHPRNLTINYPGEDTQPAFSPDGQRLAFRSAREGGGIFLLDAGGGNVRKLTDFGYNPAWSPDGQEIVFATNSVADCNAISPTSRLWAVNVATGHRRLFTASDAVQPNWSPRGLRIAYWGLRNGGRRDIWTIPAGGGESVAVTDDDFVDWNPVWSPDGRYLYFLSNRGGSMNLWRVLIDEASGKTLGAPEPITTPSAYCRHLSFSRDGRRLAYAQVIKRANLWQIALDPVQEKVVGEPRPITQGSRLESAPDLSPDGQWFVFISQGETQEDLFLIKRDGTARRQLTDDRYKDRLPRWAPDGKKIAFFSDRSGKYEIWLINPDGSGLEQLTHTPGGGMVFYPTWSPDGSRLAYRMQGFSPFILEVGKPWAEQTPQPLPALDDPAYRFGSWDWAPDGQKLAGGKGNVEDPQAGILLYSFASRQFETLTTFGTRPVWLSDNRRLLFYYQDKIYLADSRTRRTKEILSVAPDDASGYGIAPDNRAIYFSLGATEADIWLLNLE